MVYRCDFIFQLFLICLGFIFGSRKETISSGSVSHKPHLALFFSQLVLSCIIRILSYIMISRGDLLWGI